MLALDHLVIAAHTLAQGVDHVRAALGVTMPAGGAHPQMATHNHVLRLGDAVYLEVIAIDPGAPPPARPRWFQLDDPACQAELRQAPRLWTWAVRSPDIAADARPALGAIEAMQRGELRWQLTIPSDGALVDHGAVPSMIEWPPGRHPATRMPDLGCRLEQLEVLHPAPEAYRARLAALGAAGLVTIRAAPRPAFVAHIRTPDGVRVLS